MNRSILLTIGLLGTAVAAPLLAAALGRPLSLPADTPLWMVLGAAGAASLLAIAAARMLDLPALARRCVAPRSSLSESLADLADIAQIAKDDGLLPAAADPRAASHPLLVTGLYLLIRDPDERLVRSAMDAEEDRKLHHASEVRAGLARLCRWGVLTAMLAGGLVAILMALRADAPGMLTPPVATGLLTLVFGSLVWLCIGGRLADVLLQRNAQCELRTHAAKVAVLAVFERLGREATLSRLSRLLPAEHLGAASAERDARRAA